MLSLDTLSKLPAHFVDNSPYRKSERKHTIYLFQVPRLFTSAEPLTYYPAPSSLSVLLVDVLLAGSGVHVLLVLYSYQRPLLPSRPTRSPRISAGHLAALIVQFLSSGRAPALNRFR